jgi:3-phenylpropionate/trans-cinnamate dioxygenase ferredoxin reductase component
LNRDERLVIVGGGPAGLATARAYRDNGGRAAVTILTSEPYAPYNRPPLTKEFLRGELTRYDLPLEDENWYAGNDVELHTSTVVADLDRERGVVETDAGEVFPYDACVLATGSEPIRLPIPGGDDPEILVMRTIENSVRLQGQVGEGDTALVVGSGFIGCEAAASLALRGAEVTLVSLEEIPQVERLGREVGQRIRGWLEGYGVDLRMGAGLGSISRRDGGFVVTVEGGEEISAGTVLFGTGVSPRLGLAEAAGLETDGGVVTDSSMRTSGTGIFAVGDIAMAYNESAGRHVSVEHWGDALEHGRIAGTVISGGEASWGMVPGFWSTIGDKTMKYWHWGDDFWDDIAFEDRGDAFVARYGKDGTLVGVLAHGADEDYENAREPIERGAPFNR